MVDSPPLSLRKENAQRLHMRSCAMAHLSAFIVCALIDLVNIKGESKLYALDECYESIINLIEVMHNSSLFLGSYETDRLPADMCGYIY